MLSAQSQLGPPDSASSGTGKSFWFFEDVALVEWTGGSLFLIRAEIGFEAVALQLSTQAW